MSQFGRSGLRGAPRCRLRCLGARAAANQNPAWSYPFSKLSSTKEESLLPLSQGASTAIPESWLRPSPASQIKNHRIFLLLAYAAMLDEQGVQFLRAVSRLSGWIYTLSWSLSFYPQPLLNWKRKSTHGLAIDFPLLNVVGFASYTTSTACFLYSPTVRAQYAARHHGLVPTVRFNDLVFGAHAVVLVVLTYSQFFPRLWGFKVSSRQRVSKPVIGLCCGCLVALAMTLLLIRYRNGFQDQNPMDWAWIDLLYCLGYIKLAVTFVKYIPQAFVNFKRKSTQGWSIYQILFDLLGGVLSMIQLVIDASLQNDFSGITGNPLKFGLSVVSTAFDIFFIIQHYLLYRRAPESAKLTENEPLLPDRNTTT